MSVAGTSLPYLELVDFLETEGAAPDRDVRELWLRILFFCAIGNTDDHMRNHGFLRTPSGWRLSPAFDVNPTDGSGEKYLSCAIDFDDRLAHPVAAFGACEYYRMDEAAARAAARRMAKELSSWRQVASSHGIQKASQARMESCLETGIERLMKL